MHQWMGDLFYRGAAPSEIEAMTFGHLKYWHSWHELMKKEEAEIARKLKGGK